MDYKEAVEYLENTPNFGVEPGLGRIRALLEALGDPQKKLKFVHIAGTNGKGSCASMLSSVLTAAGCKTGLYTSPHLMRFNERMKLNGEDIEDTALSSVTEKVKAAADTMEQAPTAFELMTAAAMVWFRQEKCDIVVLEAGLGGRFDATNVIECPECSVIMNIGLDHTEILGGTVEKIAGEKAGIIKSGVPVVLYPQSDSVTQVIRQKADEIGAELVMPDPEQIVSQFDSPEGQAFSYKGESYAIPLPGGHQLINAAAVLETVGVLRKAGWKLEQSDVEHGLYAVSWPCRFELVHSEPDFIIDGGHNPQCIRAVADSLMRYYPDRKRIMLIGFLRDKDCRTMCEILAQCADTFVTVRPDSPRALGAGELADILDGMGKKVFPCDTVEDGIDCALELAESDGVICAAGSMYMAGHVRRCMCVYED